MISTSKSVRRQDQTGQAVVEALLVLMLLVLVIFSGFELSRGIALRQALDSGAGIAVRALSLDPSQWAIASQILQQAVDQHVVGGQSGINLQVYDTGGNPRNEAWLSGSPFGTTFILEASAPFQADIPFLLNPGITIRVRHWGIVERYP